MLDARARLMRAALGFLVLDAADHPVPLALVGLHCWLDSWEGIGDVERGMARQGYDLSLARYANEGWRATLYSAGKEHSATSATGSAWQPNLVAGGIACRVGDVEQDRCRSGLMSFE